MVAFKKNDPTDSLTIKGETFTVPQPYKEGHQCSTNEAAALNQLLKENVRNNLATNLQKQKDADAFDHAEFQKSLDAYVAEYEFGQRRGGGGGRTSDPVEKEAKQIARDLVKKKLQEQGHKLADIPNKEINRLADQAVEQYPQIRERAKATVEARQKAAEDIDLSGVGE